MHIFSIITDAKEMAMQAVFLLCIAALLHIRTPAAMAAAATSAIGGSERDRIALLAFKSDIKLDPQGVMSSWNESLHYCEWQGVTCGRKHRRVTILDLQSRGLVGSLSPYIGNLSFLMEMALQNNTLQGKIPPQVGRLSRLQNLSLHNNSLEGEVPANLSHCSNLININLQRNKLVGKIPLELASLSKLKVLAIAANNLTGGIPPSIGNLTSLEFLSLGRNTLGGSIPDALGRLKSLTALGLGGNKLSGTIPPSIYNLSLLTVLSLPSNQLHGRIPPSFGLTLPHLQFLQIRDNNLSGSIPGSLSNASKLEQIEMEHNSFTGKLSVNFGGLQHLWKIHLGGNNLGSGEADEMIFLTSLSNCTNLKELGLENNNFRGSLPSFIANFTTRLYLLNVGGNQISGGFPSWIGTLVNLTRLIMNDNLFTGTIPDDIGKLQNLHEVYLNTNKFSGEIPSSLGNLLLLNELLLFDNKLQGTIPSRLGNCQSLISLDLSQNNLSGTIPKQLFNAVALSISLNLAQNHLVGSLPLEIGNLVHLSELNISENKFSGEIPNSLVSCSSLENLYMQGNIFQGSIPSSLRSLRGLQNIDLSRNNLSGQIPSFLDNFSLKNLNLSFNNFEGEIPMEGIFTNASVISVVGNNELCGGIPELRLPKCTNRKLKRTKISFVLVLIIPIVCALVGVSMLSSFLFCWFKKKRKDQSLGSFLRAFFSKVSYGRLLKATDGFSSANLIGVGSFGSVYKGILDSNGTVVAIKVLNLQHQGASKSFTAECEALRNIRHRNLVKIITSCSSVDFQGNAFKALVYEFMPNGSLERWLHSVPEIDVVHDEVQRLNFLQRINIAIDVACALDYLHHYCHKPIVHCDLKPSNVLLDSDMTAHVGDFGLAKFLSEHINPNHQSSSLGIRGTIGYAAPEYGLGSEVSTSGDVYSYGILLLEMITRKRPTDRMFVEGLSLHNFARMASPDRVMEIIDPILLNDHEEAAVISNQRPRHARNGNKMVECLISMVKIGVACSMESPHDRMDISKVVHELHLVKDIIRELELGPIDMSKGA